MSATRRGPCPVCNRGPRDTALAMTTDERGTVSYCHRCGYTHAENLERRPAAPVHPVQQSGPVDWSLTAERIWRRTLPLRGSLAQTYLEYRRCVLPPRDSDLRYLAPADGHPPTMCARITDSVTGKPISLHFTRLAADGHGKARTDRDKLLLRGHRKQGGAIRLWPDEAVTHGLAIAEGIESALAAAHLYVPVWAAIDAGNLAALPVLVSIASLVIFADHDAAGIKAAQQCARRWYQAGREVRIRCPCTPGQDAADVSGGSGRSDRFPGGIGERPC